MTELLVLAILLEGNFTLYKIKQNILNIFSVFLSASFGSIHPAVKKLEKNGYISVKNKMSKGGQKSSVYSITPKGKKYFEELMLADISDSPFFAERIINIKLMLLDSVNKEARKTVLESIKGYYEIRQINAKDLLENMEKTEEKDFRKKLLKHYADKVSSEIKWVENFIIRI